MLRHQMALGAEPTLISPDRLRRVRRRVAAFTDTRAAAATCFVAAIGVYGIESIAWPLRGGRDSGTYLAYYVDMWHAHPALVFLMLFRTPLAPLIFGTLLQAGGAILAEIGMAIAYATSVLAYALAARSFGRATALVTAVALLLFPPYGALFHQVSSDPVFALTIALWLFALTRALSRRRAVSFAVAAVALVAMILTRPGAEVLLVSAAVAAFLPVSRRRRLVLGSVYLGASLVLLTAWAGYNDARYGDFTVARGTWVGTPFYRTFVMEKIVQPDNGPASRELAQAVRTRLLTKEPYQSHEVTVQQFFSVSDDYEWEDLVLLSDRVWGWASNYAILRRAAIEAIEQHPKLYIRDVASGMWSEITSPYKWPATPAAGAATAEPAPAATARPQTIGGTGSWLWTSPTGRKPDPARLDRQLRELRRLEHDLPDRSGSPRLAAVLNRVSAIYPRMALWILLGLAALTVRRTRASIPLLALLCSALLVVFVTLLGYGPTPEYGLPFDPIFILFGAAAVLHPRSDWLRRREAA
jgi:4-amino-4-deoxy-L-arabinose transferase-like glycosyltransferase